MNNTVHTGAELFIKTLIEQECIIVGCVLPACNHMGNSVGQRPPQTETPRQRPPLDRDPPGQRFPWTETSLVYRQTPVKT